MSVDAIITSSASAVVLQIWPPPS